MRALIKTEVSYVRRLQRKIMLPHRSIRKHANSQATFKETSQSGNSIRSEIDIEESRRKTVLRLARSLAGWRWASTKDPRNGKDFPMSATESVHIRIYTHTYMYIKAENARCNVVHNARTCRFKLLEKRLVSTMD